MIPLPIKTTMWLLQREPKQRFFFKGAVWMMFGQIVELPRVWLEEKKRKNTASVQSRKVERQNVTPV